jgi:50S ribosomal protein L16 3-hydroxylase
MNVLGAISQRAFLRGYWQKRPLFIRGAVTNFSGAADLPQLIRLASRDDVESRIVERHGARWETAHGPFPRIRLRKTNATLLVSGINLHVNAADALLRRFQFIPQARLDDVMVSYATPGGGVGPHVDSYDVFLLQGPGERRWTIWTDRTKLAYVTSPGDLLYLPPGVRHDGVALSRCYTYSIGFRAPRGAELAAAFLDWLHERGLPDAVYGDPHLQPTRNPARIPPEMIGFAQRHLARIRWTRADAAAFLGEYLSEPKSHVVFHGKKSRRFAAGPQVHLDPKTQLLYSGSRFFLNGEQIAVPAAARARLRKLADERLLSGTLASPLRSLIDRWRRLGYLHVT